MVGTRHVDNNEIRQFLLDCGENQVVAVSPAYNVIAGADIVTDARLAAAL